MSENLAGDSLGWGQMFSACTDPHCASREYVQVQVSLLAQWSRTCLLMQEIQVPALCLEDPLEEEGRATCSSILPGKSYGQRSLGGLKSIGLQRVGHD